ncbi:hypothetical protein TNCV_2750491 [Trichonephila clavipes]|nr:hypothetical protein TNCV_2750491 [Trichonephila clavipes]
MAFMLLLGKTRPLHGHKISGYMKREMVYILKCLHPPRSTTREAVFRSSGKYQAQRLPEVHPEYRTTVSERGSNRSVVWTGKEKEKWDDKRVENRQGSLEYPGFVKPVFTKDSKLLEKIGKDL